VALGCALGGKNPWTSVKQRLVLRRDCPELSTATRRRSVEVGVQGWSASSGQGCRPVRGRLVLMFDRLVMLPDRRDLGAEGRLAADNRQPSRWLETFASSEVSRETPFAASEPSALRVPSRTSHPNFCGAADPGTRHAGPCPNTASVQRVALQRHGGRLVRRKSHRRPGPSPRA
jgi:hypothetical protein